MEEILKVQQIKKYFPVKKGFLRGTVGHVKAVDGISFNLKKGETLGIVGESGCGKSTLGRTILQLTEATGGSVIFQDKNISNLSTKEMHPIRREIQMIFQDPYASLNSRKTIFDIVSEPLKIHKLYNKGSKQEVLDMLERVGLSASVAHRYPHEFSGGQRQRIGIARALILKPKIVIADEPVSALDVSIQAQVLNLMQDLQDSMGLTYIFIAHDLSVVKHISTRVAVMYLGKIVEISDTDSLYKNPLHPYTKALLSVIPSPSRRHTRNRIVLEGDLPSPQNPPTGCVFQSRCPNRMDICGTVQPELRELEEGHFAACYLYHDQPESAPLTAE
ncbi:ABC transporter ATP-binding protein [Planococcus sp. YIM B11945]|uniref:ABC transporter ATP-binding protein n=1 Tax=Planococcus sp. YIM B11945 TaxID=3435410 RepID=UPI003D7DB7D0